jgi:hypothetical protein
MIDPMKVGNIYAHTGYSSNYVPLEPSDRSRIQPSFIRWNLLRERAK